jgi:hypothetical protein
MIELDGGAMLRGDGGGTSPGVGVIILFTSLRSSVLLQTFILPIYILFCPRGNNDNIRELFTCWARLV